VTEEQVVEKPLPRIDPVSRPFWEACNAGRLVIQRCQNPACSRFVYYPRVCCPHCQTRDLEWTEVAGSGEVVTHTTIHRPHHAGFYGEAPFVFAAVRLREGPIVYARLEGAPVDGRSLIGRQVSAVFTAHSATQKLLAFTLAGE
jgi:uncharacterized OB-fold protein